MDLELYAMRHSLAHIMASAVQRLWPEVRLGIGPPTDDGFYYDLDLGEKTLSEEDFARIEKEMYKIIKEDQAFVHSDKSIDEALQWAKDSSQTYKQELLNDLKRAGTTKASELDADELGTVIAADSDAASDSASFYTNGDFTDLCRGPHVESTSKVGAFKLQRVAGAYWRGDEKKAQMQRLYAVAFATKEELDHRLKMLEEAKKRDHRKLGKELGLFTFSPLVGSGLPLFTPRGTILRDKLNQYSQQVRAEKGYQRVHIPHITKTDLYKMSGHWDKFGDELFLVESQESSDSFALKPMNCPHHTQIFASEPRSYRDMPQKFMETTIIYRDEKTGELHGIERVRAATQDDCHVFCTTEQVGEVVGELIRVAKEVYETLGLPFDQINLSFRDDSDRYYGDATLWEKAQGDIERLAKENGLDCRVDPGEAAFYGPKIDFRIADAIGRTTQTVTVQLDFVQPERFGLQYTDAEGNKQRPVMIHSTLLGSLERFLSVYIEHTAGRFPFWLAPEQLRILTINDNVADYVDEVTTILDEVVLMKPLKFNTLRYSVDTSNESLGKKIRNAESMKIPMMLIIGPKDQAAKEVSVRTQDGEQKVAFSELADFLQDVQV